MENRIPSSCHSLVVKDYRLLKFIFTILASILIYDTFYTLIVRKPTYTSHERRKISAEDFPDIIICPEPPLNLNVLNSRGYVFPIDYFHGKKFGWAGNRSEDVKILSTKISSLKSVEDCGARSKLTFDGPGNITLSTRFKLTKAVNPQLICCKVIPPKISALYPLMIFSIYFDNIFDNNLHVEAFQVYLLDKLTSSYFFLNKMIRGDKIFNRNKVRQNYRVKIFEDVNLEGDPKYPCIDYKIGGDYSQCVEKEVVRENLKFMNCTPPWMTNNEALWCKGKYELNSSAHAYDYEKFLMKIAWINEANTRKCSIPCKVKKYHPTETMTRKATNRGYAMFFESEVDVTKSSWQLDDISLLSKIGGFIGTTRSFLWLTLLFISFMGVLMSYIKSHKLKDSIALVNRE